VPGYIVKREEEGKVKYSNQSPLGKADHPTRKVITATAAGQAVSEA